MWSLESEINSIGMTTMRHSISASSGKLFYFSPPGNIVIIHWENK